MRADPRASSRRRAPRLARAQRGLVLFIALIVLVAMALASVGMVRSLDTATVVAGNLGFKEASIGAGDKGIEAAYQWLLARSGTPALNLSDLGAGYSSSYPAVTPDWTDPAIWADAVSLNGGAPDAAGYVISYLIHRMCTQPDTAYNGFNAGVANECALHLDMSGVSSGGSTRANATVFQGNPQVYYRITARVQGPRDTQSFVQSFVAITN
jgi:Tfp pilus assembly protein PilX